MGALLNNIGGARCNLAMIYRSQGSLQEAVAEMRKVVALDRLVQHPNLEADRAALAEVEKELAKQGKKRVR